ncbi:MAG TPA: sulfate adenylyltransferase [Nitrososphaeraceae archaeon]
MQLELIQPHGGTLINNCVPEMDLLGMKTFNVTKSIRTEVENIAQGVFSPLSGFLNENDFGKVLKEGRLYDGTPWTIPIIMDVDEPTAKNLKDFKDIVLSCDGDNFGILHISDTYRYDKSHMAKSVYGTTDPNHPGVKRIREMKSTLLGGRTEVFSISRKIKESRFRMSPLQTRREIKRRGWKTIVGFQTRNVPHIAHEMLQKAALNIFDGLFINPLIGKKKVGDFTDEMIINSYDALIKYYYPAKRVMFGTLHTEMRYAGPREAIHHAIMRKNFGCTHFIVGRDHAGVGDYYAPYAAHDIFKNYPDLNIEPLFFSSFYYCKKCITYANEKTCSHSPAFREELSGTMIRKMVTTNQIPEKHLMRPEVSSIIISSKNPFVI